MKHIKIFTKIENEKIKLKPKYMNDIEQLLDMVDVIRFYIGKDPIDTLCRSRKLQNNKNRSKNKNVSKISV